MKKSKSPHRIYNENFLGSTKTQSQKDKEKERKEIQEKTKEFLKQGNRVKKIKPSSEINKSLLYYREVDDFLKG